MPRMYFTALDKNKIRRVWDNQIGCFLQIGNVLVIDSYNLTTVHTALPGFM